MSITEIINGETIPPESIEEKADNAVVEALSYAKKMSIKSVGIVMLVFGVIVMVFPPFFMAGSTLTVLFAIGAAVLLCGLAIIFSKKPTLKAYKIHLSKRFAGAVAIVLLAVALFLQTLPYGVILNFSDGPGMSIRKTYAYFSLMPFGYANFFPLITAVLTVAIAVLSVMALIGNYSLKRVQNSAFVCTIIALVTSILSWCMFGLQRVTGLGVAITILIFLSLLPQSFSNRGSEQ